MKNLLKKMMEKKGRSDMSSEEKEAKMNILKDLRGQAMDQMSGNLKGLKKVSVASDTPEGLQKGLEVAKEVAGEAEEVESEEEVSGEGTEESPADEIYHAAMAMTPEEIEEEITKLMALKEQKKQENSQSLVPKPEGM